VSLDPAKMGKNYTIQPVLMTAVGVAQSGKSLDCNTYQLAEELEESLAMMRGKLIILAVVVSLLFELGGRASAAQREQDPPVFRGGVDLVRVSAVVRDKRGRFVQNLSARDFQVLEDGQPRPISDFQHGSTGISIALLFDVSGSMENRLRTARETGMHILSWLERDRDEAGVFTFDTRLDEVAPFTIGLDKLPERLASVTPFGATSLHDAIARTAEELGTRTDRRRAVIVLTDGRDTASRLTPADVSGIASAIDVPVYIIGVVPGIDNPTSDGATSTADRSALARELRDLASWTGGDVYAVSTPAERSAMAQRLVMELRHQYLIAFESSGRPGWHPLEVRARSKDLVVKARSGYIAGQSRPIS
jgi:Ca-activated chloride channel family protein